ncbi:MAG: S49 family peptidase [Rhodospirillaceae bacterium]|nr:S49 family peptidase [Rhodospirillaceae bacterium]|tara:strand:+ start:25050 stop:25910 length:861 start_codon:yes stop_codon:yes gene_type:complete
MIGRIFSILRFGRTSRVVAIVRLDGIIGNAGAFRAGLTDDRLGPVIDRAFRIKGLKALALVINSPGGSPVQSALIHDRIRRLSNEKNVPVLAFVEDVAASGGYWLAISADEIFVNCNSIVGSIGVIYSGFGFSRAMEKIGVERRLYTAGQKKSMLDPFSPEHSEDIKKLTIIQNEMHQNFINAVRGRRGQRLKGDNSELFSGEFWLGKQAMEYGLVDSLGELVSVLKERFGDDVKMRKVALRRSWFRRRFPMLGVSDIQLSEIGENLALNALSAIEKRSLWGKYGL